MFDVSSHFANGASVDVVDGTEYLGDFTVASGNATVTDVKASTSAQIGYKFTPELRTLPIDASVPGGPLIGQPRKITRVILDLEETLSVSVNGTDLILRTVQQDQSEVIAAVTGKREFRVLGYSKDPRITVTQSAPLLQINGLVAEVAFQWLLAHSKLQVLFLLFKAGCKLVVQKLDGKQLLLRSKNKIKDLSNCVHCRNTMLADAFDAIEARLMLCVQSTCVALMIVYSRFDESWRKTKLQILIAQERSHYLLKVVCSLLLKMHAALALWHSSKR